MSLRNAWRRIVRWWRNPGTVPPPAPVRLEFEGRCAYATLTYPIPECSVDLRLSFSASALAAALTEYDQWLRSQVKYGEDGKRAETLDDARTKLRDCVAEQGVDWNLLEI